MNETWELRMKAITPYGTGRVIDILPAYGVKVQLEESAEWFMFWEVSKEDEGGD
jgi:hypothetical protein